MKHRPNKAASAALAIALGSAASPVFAQGSGSGADTSQQTRASLEEIIVTAQRREESAQEVAISITVFDQEQIANANMTNAADLATYTPSLSTNTRFGAENTSFSLRGFTQSLRTTASVATYFADVVAPRGQTSQTSGDGAGPGYFFDLQNVQVLKGPQGTLFGRNTTGGAVLLVPNKPSDEFEGYVELSTGDRGSERQQAVLNVPFTDNFRMRFGVDMNERDGHLTNVTGVGANKLGDTDYTAMRLGLLWNITEDLENYTLVNYVDSESAGYTSQLFDCNTSPDEPLEIVVGLLTQTGCQAQLANQAATGQDGFYDLVSTVKTPITNITEKRLINTLTWHMNESITIKNILAYAHLETKNGSDIFGTDFRELTGTPLTSLGNAVGNLLSPVLPGSVTPLLSGLLSTLDPLVGGVASDPKRELALGVSVINPNVPVTSQETYVAELQIQGLSLDGRLIWQGGLYYENSQPDGFSGNNSASFVNCELATIETADASQYNCFDPLGGLLGGVLVQEYKTEFLNKAVYAQATYDIMESLSATLGLRYTWDEAKGYGIKTRHTYLADIAQAPIVSISTPEVESEAPTGMFELNYRPLNGVMMYAKYIRGYRQGSVNLAADPGLDTHDFETVDSYEIGAKTTFGGPVPGRFNFSIFDNELTDMQLQNGYVSATAGPTTAITNAGEAEIKGFEIESYFQLLDDLSLSVSYSDLDTELTAQGTVSPDTIRDAVTAESGNPISGELAAFSFVPIADVGESLPFAAEKSWVASLNYTLPLPADWGVASVGATYAYTGEMRAAASSATPHAILEEFAILNLNATWLGIFGSGFDLNVFGTNVRDEEYVTYVAGTLNTLGIESRQVGYPKLIGARLRYTF